MGSISQFDFDQMKMRVNPHLAVKERVVTAKLDREAELHNSIIDECRARGWIALHSSMVHKTHRIKGEFDFEIIADYGRTFLIECKTEKEKPTIDQNNLHAWARRLGHVVHVVRSFPEFLEAVK